MVCLITLSWLRIGVAGSLCRPARASSTAYAPAGIGERAAGRVEHAHRRGPAVARRDGTSHATVLRSRDKGASWCRSSGPQVAGAELEFGSAPCGNSGNHRLRTPTAVYGEKACEILL